MLNDQQLAHFEDNGYVVVDDVLDRKTTLDPLMDEYEDLMGRLTDRWVDEGRLAPEARSGTFQDKVVAAYRAGLDFFQPLDISLPGGEIAVDTPFHAGPAIFRLMSDDNLLDAVQSIIGGEITSNPIQHVRIKPPARELADDEVRSHITFTDWHQDRAVTLEEADRTRMVTAWVAVTDATAQNGCLKVIPGSHHGGMKPHCPKPQVGIPDQFIDTARALPLPVRAGGAILFHPLTIHGSLTNATSDIRWSFDLRYNVTGDPTGRPMFPEFVARSKAAPETELRDAAAWRRMWEETRARLSADPKVTLHRWAPDAAHCA